jgi:hypothetical protein
MVACLKTRTKPRPVEMYMSLRDINCSAPAVSRTSSYTRESGVRNARGGTIWGPKGLSRRERSLVTRVSVTPTNVSCPSTSIVLLYSSNHEGSEWASGRSPSTHTLNSWVIIFYELISHKTDSESRLANTSGFVARFNSVSHTPRDKQGKQKKGATDHRGQRR